MVAVSTEQGQPTLRTQAQAATDALRRGVQDDPRVREVLARFPGAEVVEVRRITPDVPDIIATDSIDSENDDD
jgi:DNA polymerase-3 subunit gamma/tau